VSDERIIRLLEEIRDLQRHHAERYSEALQNPGGVHPVAAGGPAAGTRGPGLRDDRRDPRGHDAGDVDIAYCRASRLSAEGGPVIRKLASGKYRLYSRKKDLRTGKRRNLGTFATRAAAERHERAVQFFKRGG
jgi:hypothetical protein